MARFAGAWELGLYLNRQDFEPDSRSRAILAISKDYLTLSIVISIFHFHYSHSERFPFGMIEMRITHLCVLSISHHDSLEMEPLPCPVMFYMELMLRKRFSGVCADKLLTLGRVGQFRIQRFHNAQESVGQRSMPNSRKLFTRRPGFAKVIACM